MSNIDNKEKKKCHGEMLFEIKNELMSYLEAYPDAILVREEALAMISRSAKTIQVLHKVVGLSDLCAWIAGHREWKEIHPKTIKKIIAGKDDAEKDAVARALTPYVGALSYSCDDESDAVAVGVSWLIRTNVIEAVS